MSDVQMENVVGNRHKLHPCIKHERYRGSSQIKFSDGDPDSSRPWKTTNQVQGLLTHCAVFNSSHAVLCVKTAKVYWCCIARAVLGVDIHAAMVFWKFLLVTLQVLAQHANPSIHKFSPCRHTPANLLTRTRQSHSAHCRCSPSVLRCGTQWDCPTVASAAQLPKTCTRSRAYMALLPWHKMQQIWGL